MQRDKVQFVYQLLNIARLFVIASNTMVTQVDWNDVFTVIPMIIRINSGKATTTYVMNSLSLLQCVYVCSKNNVASCCMSVPMYA